MRLTIAAAATVASLALAACGGGGSDNQTAAENRLESFEAQDAMETNGGVPDAIEGNTPADNRDLMNEQGGTVPNGHVTTNATGG